MKSQHFALAAVLLVAAAPAQGQESEEPARLAPRPLTSEAGRTLLESLGISEHTDRRLNKIVNELLPRRDPRLIPLLQEGYETAQTPSAKLHDAAQLVYLGAEDPRYWNFLYGEARAAVEAGMPAREEMAGLAEEHPELKAWREQRGVTGRQAEELLERYGLALTALSAAIDSRAFNLFVDCLAGPNHFLYIPCMQGLTRLQDKRGIEPIISALERLDAKTAGAAWVLLFFDDLRAQEAAERFITDEELLTSYRKRAARGLRATFGY